MKDPSPKSEDENLDRYRRVWRNGACVDHQYALARARADLRRASMTLDSFTMEVEGVEAVRKQRKKSTISRETQERKKC